MITATQVQHLDGVADVAVVRMDDDVAERTWGTQLQAVVLRASGSFTAVQAEALARSILQAVRQLDNNRESTDR